MLKIVMYATALSVLLAAGAAHAEETRPPRKVLAAEEGFQAPAGYVETTRPLRGLWLTGTITGVSSWGASVVSSGLAYAYSGIFTTKDDEYLMGMVPLAGPFIVAGEKPDLAPMFAALGSVQIVGLGLLIAGLAAEQTVWVLDEKADVKTTVQLAPTGVRLDF